jgi:ribosomal protein S18 acetylase RimI-like enzyme
MDVHLATLDDLSSIRNLASDTWAHVYSSIISNEQIEYMLRLFYSDVSLQDQMVNNHHQFHLIKIKSLPVAFSSFSKMNQERFRLHKLYVLPSYQQQGVGKVLMQNIFNTMKNEGARFLELNVNRQNKAIHYYQKIGFAMVREEDIDIGSGYFMNDYVMEYQLPDVETTGKSIGGFV